MQAYKFDTIISEAGIILLPFVMPDLYGKEVELFIVPKQEELNETKKVNVKEFMDRWAGFFKVNDNDPEEARYEYLMEKYK
jgi:hypothetical protein